MPYQYETNGAAIYERSFATIRAEAELDRFDADDEQVAVRMIHAAGMVELAPHIHFTPGFTATARKALEGGAPILCDAFMVAEGVTRFRLPADNDVICTLRDPQVPEMAKAMGNTRSAARAAARNPALSPSKANTGSSAMRHKWPICPSVSAVPSGATA